VLRFIHHYDGGLLDGAAIRSPKLTQLPTGDAARLERMLDVPRHELRVAPVESLAVTGVLRE
jgi:hypothetical protein